MSELTTAVAIEAIAWERAPQQGERRWVNQRVVCADGFKVSIQASDHHYAHDSSGNRAPYWADAEPSYPFTTFEVGNPDEEPTPRKTWKKYDSGGVWAFVPRQVCADLLERHGGAVRWEHQ